MMKITQPYLLFVLTLFISFSGIAQVDVITDLYSKSGDGLTTYRNTTYDVTTTDINDLAAYTLPTDVDVLNIYYNDGSSNQRYDLHGVSGKTLKAVFEGDNNETQSVDITQLRGNYREWFTLEDGKITLVNLNLTAKHILTPSDVVTVTAPLFNENGNGTQYKTTAYKVASIATMDDLANFTVDASKDWLNVYVKSAEGSEKPYDRIDISTGVAGNTLKTILEANNIAIEDLYFDYREWFKNSGGIPTLVKLNIKAIEEITPNNVEVYPDLLAAGAYDTYDITGYKINITTDPTSTDLDLMIIAADVDFVSIYLADGTRKDKYISTDTTIKAILTDQGVLPSELKDNYREWFVYLDNGGVKKPTLKNINFKASKITGSLPKVTQTPNLFNDGATKKYSTTAYFVRGNAALADMNAYQLAGDFISIYYIDLNTHTNQRLDVSGKAGQNLGDVLAAELITVSQLRTDYVEWFRDSNGDLKLVNLNIKDVTEIGDVDKIVTTPDLYSKSGTSIFENVAYYGKDIAALADFGQITLAADIEYVNIYTTVTGDVNAPDGRYSLHGVGGKTLEQVLNGSSTEGTIIDITTLRNNYVEWFHEGTDVGNFKSVKLNIKSVKTSTLSVEDDVLKASTSVYPNPVVDYLHVSIEEGMSFEYVVYSTNGAVVLRGSSNQNKTTIDVSALSNGVYILNLKSGAATMSSKFIK